MPNLPNSSPEKDIEMFDEIIDGEDLIADEWKIYPTSITTTSDKDNAEVRIKAINPNAMYKFSSLIEFKYTFFREIKNL